MGISVATGIDYESLLRCDATTIATYVAVLDEQSKPKGRRR